MTTPVNLNKARKARAKVEAKSAAATNRAAFGRTRAEKEVAAQATANRNALLDGAKREP